MKKYMHWTAMVCLLCGPLLAAQGMNNEDVVKMSRAGLAEETIVVAIQHAEKHDFDTSPMALVALKEAGLSDAVIQTMIAPKASEVDTAVAEPKSFDSLFKDVPTEEVMPPVIVPEVGSKYYTRINFWHEDGTSIATNYSRGLMVPINSLVELVSFKSKEFRIRTADGAVIKITNEPKYTSANIKELMSRYLAGEPTKIELYGEEAVREINLGELRLGMTKDQVLLTRGYPPFHETASLDADRWTYWSSRFVKLTLVFDNGRLAEGRGLH